MKIDLKSRQQERKPSLFVNSFKSRDHSSIATLGVSIQCEHQRNTITGTEWIPHPAWPIPAHRVIAVRLVAVNFPKPRSLRALAYRASRDKGVSSRHCSATAAAHGVEPPCQTERDAFTFCFITVSRFNASRSSEGASGSIVFCLERHLAWPRSHYANIVRLVFRT